MNTVGAQTCQAEGFEAKLHAIENDKAEVVEPYCRVLPIALKVAGLLTFADLFDLSDVNCGARHT